MWRHSGILIQAIRPQMAQWWLKRGMRWVAAYLLLNLLFAALGGAYAGQMEGQLNTVYMAAAVLVSACASSLGLWLAWLLMTQTNAAIASEFGAEPAAGWLSTRVRFLVYQRQILPVLLLFPVIPWLGSELSMYFAGHSVGMSWSRILSDSMPLQLLFNREMRNLIVLVWYCALAAVSQAGLLQARRIVLVHWLTACLYFVPLLLSGGMASVALDQEGFLRGDLITAVVSLLAMLLWLLAVKSSPWRLGNTLSWMVALYLPVLDALRLWNSSSPGMPVLRTLLLVLHTLFFGFSSPPSVGEGLAAWVRLQFPQQQTLLGFAERYAHNIMQLLWLVLLYALVWGIVLRPGQREVEQHPVVTALSQPQ